MKKSYTNLCNGKRFFSVLFLLFLSLNFFGCFGSQNAELTNEQVYASVNGVKLTESKLRSIVPQDFYDQLTQDHKREIIEDWVNHELIYQESVRRGIGEDPEIEQLLFDSRRNLLSNELLEREYADIYLPTDEELIQYYEDNKDYFQLQTDEYRVRYALFDNRNDTTDFHARVKRNESFSDLAQETSKDPSSQDGGNLGFVNEESIEPAIWDEIISTNLKYGIRRISDVFRVTDGWACVIVDEILESGSVKPIQYVRDLVMDMYMTEYRDREKNKLIEKLTAEADVRYEFP